LGLAADSVPLQYRDAPQRRRTAEVPDASAAGTSDDVFESSSDALMHQGFGTHYVNAWVGTPPQRVALIVDTGSHMTAFPCTGCKGCGSHVDPYFDIEASSTFEAIADRQECELGNWRELRGDCFMSQRYVEGSRWYAFEARDTLYIGANDSLAMAFNFGCQMHETRLFVTQLADGILGMNRHPNTLDSQLAAKGLLPERSFALCLSLGGGLMKFGGPAVHTHQEDMQYISLVEGNNNFYTVQLEAVYIGDHKVQTNATTWSTGKGTIVDSGTTDTYLPRAGADAFRQAWKAAVGSDSYSNKPVRRTLHQIAALPAVTFEFEGGVRVVMPPEVYMERRKNAQHMYVPRIYLDEHQGAVLGANFMQGHDVHFDPGSGRIGFARADCDAS